MKIANDKINFDDGDIAQLSPAMQKALQLFVGTNTDPDTGAFVVPAFSPLNTAVNAVLDNARKLITKAQSDNLADLTAALALADDATKAQAQLFLDQAAAVVGITIKPQPSPTDPPIDEPPILAQAAELKV